jgi:capsular polysaccharide transport system permease protein
MPMSELVSNRRMWGPARRPSSSRGSSSFRGFTLGRWRIAARIVLVLLPTLLTAVYYGAIATDRYVSEARFVIRTASKPSSLAGGLGALLQLVGMSRSEDDAYAVRDFLLSRDAQ